MTSPIAIQTASILIIGMGLGSASPVSATPPDVCIPNVGQPESCPPVDSVIEGMTRPGERPDARDRTPVRARDVAARAPGEAARARARNRQTLASPPPRTGVADDMAPPPARARPGIGAAAGAVIDATRARRPDATRAQRAPLASPATPRRRPADPDAEQRARERQEARDRADQPKR